MNILPREKQVEAIASLCEGVSIRATERLTGVNRGTILSLGVRVGDGILSVKFCLSIYMRSKFCDGEPTTSVMVTVLRRRASSAAQPLPPSLPHNASRSQQRRFTRLTNAFSKKLENHVAAVALYVAHYNFCRVHEALRVTPAMQLGVTDHIWTIGELVDAALEGVLPAPGGRRYGRFTVMDGGRE
jgi:hypothetical protein